MPGMMLPRIQGICQKRSNADLCTPVDQIALQSCSVGKRGWQLLGGNDRRMPAGRRARNAAAVFIAIEEVGYRAYARGECNQLVCAAVLTRLSRILKSATG
jgi:hypothetical protein